MKTWTFCLVILFTGLVGCISGDPSEPDTTPSTADSDRLYTIWDWHRDVLDFHRREMAQAYEDNGQRNPLWDDVAMELLEGSARRFTRSLHTSGFRHALDVPSSEQLVELGRRAQELGCTDPLVLFALAEALPAYSDREERIAMLKAVVPALEETDYHPAIKAKAWLTLRDMLPEDAPDRDKSTAFADQNIWDAFYPSQIDEIGRQWVFDEYVSRNYTNAEALAAYCEAAKNYESPDPWAVALVSGTYHIRLAWDKRGSDWGSEVTPEGWEGFETHLHKARQFLTEAYRLQPQRPEAAAKMLTVVMGQGESLGDTLDDWLDRVIDARFDYMLAYHKFGYAIEPKWGGSNERMLAFALRCAASDRYDTSVPFHFFDVVRSVIFINDDDHSYWQRPDVYAAAQRVLEGLANEPLREPDRDYWRSWQVVVAWRAGDYERARRLLVELGDRMIEKPWGSLDGSKDEAVGQIYLYTSDANDAVRQADASLEAGQWAHAVAQYNRALDVKDLHPAAIQYVKVRRQSAIWNHQYQLGEKLVLSGPELADIAGDGRAIPGWKRISEDWQLDPNGDLTVTIDKRWPWIELAIDPGLRWEFSGKIDVSKGSKHNNASVGAMMRHFDPGVRSSAEFIFNQDKARWTSGTLRGPYVDVPMAEEISFKMQRWNERFMLEVNGVRVLENYAENEEYDQISHPVGLGSLWRQHATTYRFYDLTLHSLGHMEHPPDWYDPSAVRRE